MVRSISKKIVCSSKYKRQLLGMYKLIPPHGISYSNSVKVKIVISKARGYWLNDPGLIPDVGGVEIFLNFFVSELVLESTLSLL